MRGPFSSSRSGVISRRTVSTAAAVSLLAATLVIGVAAPAQAALPAGPSTVGVTGARPSATQLQFPISDQVTAAVDVVTGNLLVTNSSLSLRGVTADVNIGQSYNSLGTSIGSTSIPAATNWTVGVDGAGYLSQGTGAVIYTAADGATWKFTPVAGSSTAFTSPAGFKSDLVASATNYKLTDRTSRQVIAFNLNGQPTSTADRNGNTTTIGYTGANPTSVVSSAGPTAARTASLAYDAPTYTLTVSQSSGSSSRNVKYVKDANSNLVSIVDALGKTTSFGYSGSKMTSITAPNGQVTTVTYGSTAKVEKIAQANTSGGSPGTSTTRISYPSGTQTLVAGPNTDQALAITAVPRTTYTVNATSKLATSVVDAAGRSRAATYTPNADVASSTSGTGATAGTSTATYGANNGESQTQAKTPGGATQTAAYANTDAATKYLASSSTDDSSNASTFTYNGAGNALSSTNALAATATLTYNTDGTLATATAPGNGTNKTVYAYNATKQLSTVTPVTGSSLGVRTFTYDDFGRVRTATNGRGTTITYGYDQQDRVLTTQFSDGTPTVVNSYTDGGLVQTRQDANGTTQYGYDQLGRLTSRQNSFGGGVISYAYDRASNLASTTDSRGTSTYAYDSANVPTQITYAKPSGTSVLGFTNDNQGRRTDSYLATNTARTTWAAHTHNDYDTTGRVSRTIAETGPATDPTVTLDVSYCYNNATPAPTCGTGATGDRSKLQWEVNNLTGESTTYTYDTGGRIIKAATSGWSGGVAKTWNYTYDARGNRLTASTTGGTPTSQTFTVNAANQITSTGYTFDGAGNMTADTAGSYTYNGAEQMTAVTQGSNTYDYKYAGAGQNEVLEQERSGTTYQVVYGRTNQQGQPVIEQAKAGANTAYVENDPVTGQPLMLRTSTGTVSLYVYSGTGSPVGLLTDFKAQAFAYQYDPYGVPVVTQNSGGTGLPQNPFLFQGGIQDRATGWVKYGARWYNPTTGRWTQQDTLDNPLDPNNANRYSFAGDDPINNIDPTGRNCAGALLGLGVGVLGVGLAVAGLAAAVSPAGIAVAAASATGAAFVEAGAAASAVGYIAGSFGTVLSLGGVADSC